MNMIILQWKLFYKWWNLEWKRQDTNHILTINFHNLNKCLNSLSKIKTAGEKTGQSYTCLMYTVVIQTPNMWKAQPQSKHGNVNTN